MSTPVNDTPALSARAINQVIAQHLMDQIAAQVEKFPPAGRKISGVMVTPEQFLQSAKQFCGYTPHQCTWPAAFGARDVGRPVTPAKSTAPKSTAPKSTGPKTSGPKTSGSASKSTRSATSKPAGADSKPATPSAA